MASIVMNQVNTFLRQRKDHRRWIALFLALACVVTYATLDRLKYDGQALNHKTMELRCTAHGLVAHEHNDDCYDENGELRCPLPELELHEHDDSCYEEMAALVCDKLESDGHVHDASCYERVRDEEPSCGIENENHEHSDACYGWHEELICDIPEGEGAHHHGLGCYEIQMALACGLPEVTEEHVHDDDCFVEIDMTAEEVEELVAERDGAEIVEVPEKPALTGEWSADLLTAAESRIGETDLDQFIEWYGADAQADAAFISWSLHTAEVPSKAITRFGDAGAWAKSLQETELWHGFENDEPAEGDLLFLRLKEPEEGEEEVLPDHIALFTGTVLNQAEERFFKVIEVWGDRVIAGEYPDDDPALMGFMAMPDAQEWKQAQLNADLPAQKFEGEAGGVKVTVEADAGAFPADTTMVVTTVAAEDLPETVTEAVAGKVSGVEAVDIAFFNADGEEIEPLIPIRVAMTTPRIAHADVSQVVHVTADGEANLVEQTPASQLDDTPGDDQIVFDADGFSVYAIVYTVDFHWNVEGRELTLSIHGGEALALRELLAALEIMNDDPDTEENEFELMMAAVAEVTFSDPSLVRVARPEEDTVVAALRGEDEVEYSAELTEEQIAAIGETPVPAGEWMLLSLRPFTTDETLTVRLKNGDELTVAVTDAQQITDSTVIDTQYSYIIAVPYGNVYHVLRTDGTTATIGSVGDFDSLDNSYKWTFNFVFEEKDLETSLNYRWYFIRPIDNGAVSLSLNTPGSGLVQTGTNNVAILPNEDGSFRFVGYNGAVLSHLDFWGFVNTSTIFGSAPPAAIQIYQQDPLSQYDYTVNTADESMGTVRVTPYTTNQYWPYNQIPGTPVDGAEHYLRTNGDKMNAEQITAVPVSHMNAGQNKYIFDHWELNGQRLEGYGQTINAGTLEIPYQDSVLTAFFKVNPNYEPTDDEKQGSDFEDLTEWLEEIKTRRLPLVEEETKKTAEVYDYENRIYRVDLTTKASLETFDGTVDLGFILDVSNSMKFPSDLRPIEGMDNIDIRAVNGGYWADGYYHTQYNGLTRGRTYYLISDPRNTSTVYRIEYRNGSWMAKDASAADSAYAAINASTAFKASRDSTSDNNFHYQLYFDAEPGRDRFSYLNESIANTTQAMTDILETLELASSNNPSVRIAYSTFNVNLGTQQSNGFVPVFPLSLDFSYSAGGGTRPDQSFIRALNWDWDALPENRYVVLITDGAPQGTRTGEPTMDTPTIIETRVKPAVSNLKGNKGVKLITVGLSMKNVDGGRIMLYDLADTDEQTETRMFYSAETGEDLKSILLQIVKTLMKKVTVTGKVVDTIGEAFYPVDRETGRLLEDGDKIDLLGNKLADDYSGPEPYGVISGNGSVVTWENQDFAPEGWHGTVFVKAREDFLGGNAVKTNAITENAAYVEADGYRTTDGRKVLFATDEETLGKLVTKHIDFTTPRVNVNELDFSEEKTEWTVYLGTEVDPKDELERLFNTLLVSETTQKGHTLDTDGDGFPDQIKPGEEADAAYDYNLTPDSIVDNREEDLSDYHDNPETFKLADLIVKLLTKAHMNQYMHGDGSIKWDKLLEDALSDDGIVIPYDEYGLDDDSTLTIRLAKTIIDPEKDETESPHATTVVSPVNEDGTQEPVEKYTLSVVFDPDYDVLPLGQGGSADLDEYQVGSSGTVYQGNAAGRDSALAEHEIRVVQRWLQLLKTNLDGNALKDAEFLLYAPDPESSTSIMVDGVSTKVTAMYELKSGEDGIAELKPVGGGDVTSLTAPPTGNIYYLVETNSPAGYNLIGEPLKVTLAMADQYYPLPDRVETTTKPDTAPYDWNQCPEDGKFLTITNIAGTPSGYVHDMEVVTVGEGDEEKTVLQVRILNTNGYELPMTGGQGTGRLMAFGLLLTIGAGAALSLRRRAHL